MDNRRNNIIVPGYQDLNIEAILLLVRNGIHPNSKEAAGETPLNVLCLNVYPNTIAYMEVLTSSLTHGVKLDEQDTNDATALHRLCSNYPFKTTASSKSYSAKLLTSA